MLTGSTFHLESIQFSSLSFHLPMIGLDLPAANLVSSGEEATARLKSRPRLDAEQ
jgi:hypothetical protein